MKSTKELARELGLLRKRSVSNSLSSREVKNQTPSNQPFLYLLVLDFESTCWKDCKYKPQEIIEFPCVLLNTQTGQVESEFQYYVQPCEHPILSDFCKELTGITQEQVEQGIPLSLCLKKFEHWLCRLHKQKGVTFTAGDNKMTPALTAMVTWSDWDLGVCLLYECRRKQISKPSVFNSWIDLRATYRKFYSRKPQGLNGALQDVGIEFEGREHSGLCDARNTARLAWRMIRDGCVMRVTKTIKPSSSGRSEMAPSSIENDRGLSKGSVQPKRPVPMDKSSKNIPVLNKNLPVLNKNLPVLNKNLPVLNNKILHRCMDVHIYCDAVDSPKAKMPRFKSPQKTTGSVGNDVNRVCSTADGLTVRMNTTYATSDTAATCSKVDTQSHFTAISARKIDSSDKSSHKTPSSAMTSENRVDRLSDITDNSSGTNNSAGRTSHSASSSPSLNNDANKASRVTSCLTVRNNNMESSSHTPRIHKHATALRSPKPCRSAVPPRSCSRTPLQTLQTANIHTPVTYHQKQKYGTTPLTCYSNLSTATTHRHSSVLPVKSAGTFKTPSPVGGPFVNKLTTTMTTPRNVCNISAMKSASTFKTPSPVSGPLVSSTSAMTTPRNVCNVPAMKSASTFKTPSPVSGPLVNKSTSAMTTPKNMCSMSAMKSTPPLCKCGRRSKRKMVQSPGPNLGRFFFSCGQGRGLSDRNSGCGFFQWEKESIPRGRQLSRLGQTVGKPYTPVLNMNKMSWSSVTPVLPGRQIGIRSSQNTKCLR